MTVSLKIENITKLKADLAANLNRINILGNLVMNELKLAQMRAVDYKFLYVIQVPDVTFTRRKINNAMCLHNVCNVL